MIEFCINSVSVAVVTFLAPIAGPEMATRLILGSVIVWLCILSNSCWKDAAPEAAKTETDVGPVYVIPAGTGAKKIDGVEYAYVATRERESEIIAGFKKLKVGQSREVVRNLLGPPDFAEPSYNKQGNEFRGWKYMYKIKMREGGPNMNDVCVQVFFDPTGRIHWAVPEAIPNLREVGTYKRTEHPPSAH